MAKKTSGGKRRAAGLPPLTLAESDALAPKAAKRLAQAIQRQVPGMILFKCKTFEEAFVHIGVRQKQVRLEFSPWQAMELAKKLEGGR